MPLPVMTFTDPYLSQPDTSPVMAGIQRGVNLASQLEQMQQRAAMAPLTRQLTQGQIAAQPLQQQLTQAQIAAQPLQQQLTQAQIAAIPLHQKYLAGQIAAQPYQQQLIHAQAKMNLAKALQAQAAAKAPFGGKFLPGAGGRTQGLMYMAQKFGTDSWQYKNTLRDYNADIKAKLSKADYYEANLVLKNVPDTTKMQIFENYDNEQAARKQQGLPAQKFKEWYRLPANQAAMQPIPMTPTIAGGVTRPQVSAGQPTAPQVPATTQQVTPTPPGQAPQVAVPTVQPQVSQASGIQPQMPQATAQAGLTQEPFGQEARQLGVGITTKTVPTFVLQKLGYARNIQKTIARMPERAITAYSENPAKLANDYRKSLHGEITPDYAEYLRFITNAKFLSTQTRQFYQDTIQPNMLKRLDNMTNPISWRTNPKAALIAYHAMTGTLGKEIGTYIDEASDPKFVEKMRESKVLRGMTPHGTIPAPKQAITPKAKGVTLTQPTKDLTKLSNAELLNMYRQGK